MSELTLKGQQAKAAALVLSQAKAKVKKRGSSGAICFSNR